MRVCDVITEAVSADYNTARALAKEMAEVVQELGQAMQGSAGAEYKQKLKLKIKELDREIRDLGFLYNPLAKDHIEQAFNHE